MTTKDPPVPPRTAVTSPATDEETATDGLAGTDDDRRRALQALDIMRERGLIPAADYERRRRALLGAP